MALKADRYELQTDISFFCDEALTRGGIVCHDSTAGSGAAMDQGAAKVVQVATPTNNGSFPVGVLLNDVVDKDLTRTHLNQHKDEVQKGGKVTILRKGYVVTNMVQAIGTGGTPVAGHDAYLTAAGKLYANSGERGSVGSGNLLCGRFLSAVDADGYAKVEINLP